MLMLLLIKFYHLYHLVELSPWPLFCGFISLVSMTSMVMWFKTGSKIYLMINFISLLYFMLMWFRDINRESILLGKHSFIVERGFQMGMILFIFSEVMFFFSFFWTFFHSSLNPCMEIGNLWPPFSIMGISPFEIPLLNTLVLLGSGVSVTWAHFLILQNKSGKLSLLITLMLGIYFTFLQGMEYFESSFSIFDSVYGSIFFVTTGFHGLHVIIGSILLFYSLMRMMFKHFSLLNPIGLELSIWYWHFVDVVWLFLFSFVYWWGI